MEQAPVMDRRNELRASECGFCGGDGSGSVLSAWPGSPNNVACFACFARRYDEDGASRPALRLVVPDPFESLEGAAWSVLTNVHGERARNGRA
jgi:hypothetical protein